MVARRNLVVGLGKTGVAAVRWLHSRGEAVTITDSRATPPGLESLVKIGGNFPLHLGGFDLAILNATDRIVLSPGVSPDEPLIREARARGIAIVGDIELFAGAKQAPAVAITGTNGKSTVTTLVAEMARAAGRNALAGGNLGEPALDLLDRPVPDLYVLELSSFQLESTDTLDLIAAAVLNLTPDHMDRYATLADYGAAKARVFAHAAVAVVNLDDPIVNAMPRAGQARIGFSLTRAGADWGLTTRAGEVSLTRAGEPLLPLAEMRISGRHNAANALAALAVGTIAGLALEPMLATLRRFAGLPHRSQWIAERNGVRFIDDSKGTNVGATLASVEGLGGPIVVIAGGDGKGQDFAPLATAFRGKVRHAVLIGRDRELIARSLAGVCSTEFAPDMDAAVVAAARAARAGDLVLLSPACASFDMFRDYIQRGEVFAAAARRLEP